MMCRKACQFYLDQHRSVSPVTTATVMQFLIMSSFPKPRGWGLVWGEHRTLGGS